MGDSGGHNFECHIQTCTRSFGSPQGRAAHFGQTHSLSERQSCYARALHDLADDIGGVPTRDDMREHGRFSAQPYEEHFGSWSTALRVLGYPPNHENRISEPRLLSELERVGDRCGGTPREVDMVIHGKFSHDVYVAHFGSWNAAVEAAGFEPNQVYGLGTTQLYYGPRWRQQRAVALERDGHECRVCGRQPEQLYNKRLHVHHITPARTYGAHESDVETNYSAMNHPSNLISLCPSCHGTFEGNWTEYSPHTFMLRAQAERYLEDHRDQYDRQCVSD